MIGLKTPQSISSPDPTCVECHECLWQVFLGDWVGHETGKQFLGPILDRRVDDKEHLDQLGN